MPRRTTRGDLVAALSEAGVRPGDLVHVQSDLARVGPVEAGPRKSDVLEFYFSAFRECLGGEGTLSTATFFYDYGRKGVPFDRARTPSQTGVFSEYVRTRPGAVRSRHPIVSVAMHGARAHLADGPHFSGYGRVSPWAELHRHDALLVSLGLGTDGGGGMSFVHYCEALYGVPYAYTKLFTTPVLDDGRPVEGEFTLSVLYQDLGVRYDSSRFRRRLVEEGKATAVPLGWGEVFCVRAGVMVDEAMKALTESRFCFLAERPAFVPGRIPTDGPLQQATSDR